MNVKKNAVVVKEEVNYKDIKQGKIANCYFVAALSAVATVPSRFDKILLNSDFPKSGIQISQVKIRGSNFVILVDNYLPFNSSDPTDLYFAEGRGNETWV